MKSDLTGMRFGRLLVIRINGVHPVKGSRYWLCQCDCGNQVTVRNDALKKFQRSCGCLTKERMTTHGMSNRVPEYKVWDGMKCRCNQPSHEAYKYYGGKGIKICKRWAKFENFYKDMGPRPTPKHSIDRIKSNLGYRPSNCVWATRKEQARHVSRNKFYTLHGRTQGLKDWCKEIGIISYTAARERIKRGMSLEKALYTPSLVGKGKLCCI